jgi:hypothetical protein
MLCCDMNMEWKGEMHPFDSRVCDMNDGIVVGGTRCKRIRAMRNWPVRDRKSSLTAFTVSLLST